MSKEAQLRALREARYEASRPAPSRGGERRLSRTKDGGAAAAAVGGSQPAIEQTLCGHQSIGNKRCIRVKDHPEKNHRYAKS
jgi:hypothetical protein